MLAALLVRWLDEWWSYLPAGVIEDLRVDLGVSYAESGWLIAIAVISGLVGGPLGALSDHVDRRRMAVLGALLQTLGLVAFAVGSSFVVLAIAVFVLGAASDLVVRPLESGLAEEYEADLDRLLGRQHLLSFVGDFVGPGLLALGAATALGWRGAFWITAATMALFSAFLATVHFPSPPRPERSSGGWLREYTVLARRRDVWLLAMVDILLLPLDEPILGFAVARVAFKGENAVAQVLAGGYVIGGILGSLFCERRGVTRQARRWSPWLLLGGAVFVAVGSTAWVATLGMVPIGIGMAVVWTMVHERQLTIVPGRSATVSSFVSVVGSLGALGPILIGAVAVRFGLTPALWVTVGVAAVLVIVVRAAAPAPIAGEVAGEAEVDRA